MGIVYLDSSVALRTILDVPERVPLQKWMQTPGMVPVSSRLLRTEIVRVLRRDARPLTDGTPLLDRIGMLDITPRPTQSPSRSNDTSRRSTLSTSQQRFSSGNRSPWPATTRS